MQEANIGDPWPTQECHVSLADVGDRLADITRSPSGPQVHTGDPLTDIRGLMVDTTGPLANTDNHAGTGGPLADGEVLWST